MIAFYTCPRPFRGSLYCSDRPNHNSKHSRRFLACPHFPRVNTEKTQTFRYTLYISPLFPRRRKLYTTALRSTTLSSCCPPLTCRVPIKRRGKKVLGGGARGKLIASLSKIFVVVVSKSVRSDYYIHGGSFFNLPFHRSRFSDASAFSAATHRRARK